MNHRSLDARVASVTARVLGIFLIGSITLLGCKKQEAPTGTDVQILDASKFRPAFASAPPEQQAIVDSVMMSIQGSELAKARADLDKLAAMPGVTDPQKAVIKNLSDQLDKKIAATASASAPK